MFRMEQTCTINIETATKLGLQPQDLLATSMGIKGASGKPLDVAGCALIKITIWEAITRQVVYICEGEEAINVLSRETCQELGLVPKDFPDVKNNWAKLDLADAKDKECECIL